MDKCSLDMNQLVHEFRIQENLEANGNRPIKVVAISAIQKVGYSTAGMFYKKFKLIQNILGFEWLYTVL
jgi:YesN/AraC family two-component response regulator